METISLFFLIEAIGTIAIASSGAMTAIRKRLDLLGVIILEQPPSAAVCSETFFLEGCLPACSSTRSM